MRDCRVFTCVQQSPSRNPAVGCCCLLLAAGRCLLAALAAASIFKSAAQPQLVFCLTAVRARSCSRMPPCPPSSQVLTMWFLWARFLREQVEGNTIDQNSLILALDQLTNAIGQFVGNMAPMISTVECHDDPHWMQVQEAVFNAQAQALPTTRVTSQPSSSSSQPSSSSLQPSSLSLSWPSWPSQSRPSSSQAGSEPKRRRVNKGPW